MIGNAAAALHGAPVTTLDVDFMFRKTPANIRKLKRIADTMGGQLLRPFYPLSGLYRLVVDDTGMQFDFMLYPKSRHGVGGPLRKHLQQMMLEFIEENLLRTES